MKKERKKWRKRRRRKKEVSSLESSSYTPFQEFSIFRWIVKKMRGPKEAASKDKMERMMKKFVGAKRMESLTTCGGCCGRVKIDWSVSIFFFHHHHHRDCLALFYRIEMDHRGFCGDENGLNSTTECLAGTPLYDEWNSFGLDHPEGETTDVPRVLLYRLLDVVSRVVRGSV